MPPALELLVQTLLLTPATWLLVFYLTNITITGPFDIFDKIRLLAGIEKETVYSIDGEEEVVSVVADRFWAGVLNCHRCCSPYMAFLVIAISVLTGLTPLSWAVLVLWLSVTGLAILIFEVV